MINLLAENDIQQQPQCTYVVHIYMRYITDQRSEILSGDEENTAFFIEDLASQALLTVFDSAIIDDVSITNLAKGTAEESPYHVLHLYSRCPHRAFPSGPDQVNMIEYALEQKLGCAFLQLFHTLEVELVDVRFVPIIPTEYNQGTLAAY